MESDLFNDIIKKYYKEIYLYCSGRLDKSIAEDITQEVFLTLYEKINLIKFSKSVHSWLYKTAENKIRNYIRKNSRETPVESEKLDIPETGVSPETAFDNSFKEILGEAEYKLVKSFYLDGMTVGDISEKLHISEQAVRSRIQRTRLKIKKKLSENNK